MRLPRTRRSRIAPLLVVLAGASFAPGSGLAGRPATELRMTAADERGVTLALELPGYDLGPAGADGRAEITGTGLPCFSEPGRPRLPYAYALIALPPGARAVAAIAGGAGEEARDGVRLTIGDRSAFRDDAGGLGLVPTREPVAAIVDGSWPAAPVVVGEPFEVRRQRMVAVQVRPFRYDEGARRLWARRSITVRVSFVGGAAATGAPAAEDRHWDPVLERAVLNYAQGRSWRARAPGSGGATLFGGTRPGRAGSATAFDEGQTEVRVRVDTSGVYGLEYSKLAAANFPANVPISELSVHRHEYVENANPPYVTVELPIEVEEGVNKNGVFDAGDRIDVWVQNWAERSRASGGQRVWGDADYVYVTRLPGGLGKRLGLRSGWRATTPPVLPSYPWTQRWERNFTYMNFPPDTNTDPFNWTEITEYYPRPDTFQFEVNHLDASQPVSFSIALQGRKANTHWTWCDIENGSGQFTPVVDSVLWAGKGLQIFSATLAATAFTEGRTNRMRFWGKTDFSPPDPVTNEVSNMGLNWFEATYWRSYRALGGPAAIDRYLACNSGNALGEYEIAADGFTTDSIRAYDVSDSLNPVRLSDVVIENPAAGQYRLRLQDQTAGPPHRYAIFSLAKLLPASRYSVVNRQGLYAKGPADYLLVAPEAFLPAANALAALRQSEGLNVLVAPLEAVNDEFNGGRKSAYSVRRFIRYAYDNWNARFVLLMGDGSEDPRNLLLRSGTDWIPAPRIFGPVSVFTGDGFFNEIVASDPWYVWAVDTPPLAGRPYLPDLYLGRLPANSLTQATDMVNKLVAYARVDTTQTWRRRMLLHADDAWSGATTFGGGGAGGSGYCFHSDERRFVSLSRFVQAAVADSAGLALCEPEVFDCNVLLGGEPVDASNCRPDMAATQQRARTEVTQPLVDRLNDGRLWWNYQGHANAYVMQHEYVWRNFPFDDDLTQLTNDGKPFFFSAFSCHANQFAQVREADPTLGPCIGEKLVTVPSRGAIGSWASTGYEAIPSDSTLHLDVQLAKALFSKPPRDNYLGAGSSAVLGEGIALALLQNYAATSSNPNESDVGITYTLLGDPATRFTVGAPQIVVTANGVPVTSGQAVFLPGASDTLLLAADLVSNAALDSISLERKDETGTVVFPPSDYTLTPPFPDTGPSQGGGRRFLLVYRAQVTAGRYTYTIRTRDRYGVTSAFDVVFDFLAVLRAEGRPLRDDDPVARDAALSLKILSPNVLDPGSDLTLEVDGIGQPFTATPNTPGRQFVLSWTHLPYSAGAHVLRLSVRGGPPAVMRFQVIHAVRLADLMNFPNPFDDERGTRFTFTLMSDTPADLLLRVYTVSGRLLYTRTERGMPPGYHELAWDGRDAEGDKLANGVYLYRLQAVGPSGHASELGRLVKLRRPRQAPSPSGP